MDPVQQARLNPTATNVYIPQEGIFRSTAGDPVIYKRVGNELQTFDLTSLLSQQERQALGNYGAQSQEAINRFKTQYGLDFNTINQANIGDLFQSLARQGVGYTNPEGSYIAPLRQSTNINDFLNQQMAQMQTQTINAQANTLGTPQPGTQQNNAQGTVQPSQQQPTVGQLDQSMVNPNAPQGPGGLQGAVQTPQQQNQAAATPPSQPAQTYTIQSGDTLSKLAAQYGTTVGALMSLNPQITDANRIYAGQKINLTPSQVSNTQGIQAGLNAATLQAQAIQQQISSAFSPTSSADPIIPATANGQTPTSNFMETYSKVAKELGLSDIKSAYTKALDESKELEDKKNDEAQKINNNPWYSQGKRQLELQKLDSKYETKLNTLSNYAKLYDSLYQEGLANAEFLTTGIQKEQQFALELAQKKQEAIDKLMEQDIRPMSINGREVLVDLKTQKVVADLGASKVASSGTSGLTDYQATQAFIGISNKFQADNIVNQAIKGQTAVAIAQQVIANPSSATNQLKSLYSLVKNLDPDSAVREGEIALANQTTSYLQRFQTSLERINKGQVISPDAAKALAQATIELASAWNDTAQRRTQQYQSQANTAGIGSQFNQYLGGFQISPQSTQTQTTNWSTDYNYTRDIELARQAIQAGADEGAVRARLLTKYQEVNL